MVSLPPGSTAARPRAAASPRAAAVSASGQDAGGQHTVAPRTSGVASRSGWVA